MSTPEIVRVYEDGQWKTEVGSSGGGGGGGISEITSTDESVTITDPSGPTVDLSVSGGSQTVFQTAPQTIGFAQVSALYDPDLFGEGTGGALVPITEYEPLDGDVILGVCVSRATSFEDGGFNDIFVGVASEDQAYSFPQLWLASDSDSVSSGYSDNGSPGGSETDINTFHPVYVHATPDSLVARFNGFAFPAEPTSGLVAGSLTIAFLVGRPA